MAGWVFTVDQNYPQHVDYAVQHGFWDTTKQFSVQAGDDVFFWQNGAKRLVGHFQATSSAEPIGEAWKPWDDDGVRTYHYRVHMRLLSRDVRRSPSWSELQAIIGNRSFANSSVIEIKNSEGVRALADRFHRMDVAFPPDVTLLRDREPSPQDYPDLPAIPVDEDARDSAIRAVVLRRGQQQFREQLLEHYGHCLVTGSSVPAVLEAAHISPYKGPHTNQLGNGLLLRSDVHTLFDLNLLTITADSVIHVAPELRDTTYGGFHNDDALFRDGTVLRPDEELLSSHNDNCSWL